MRKLLAVCLVLFVESALAGSITAILSLKRGATVSDSEVKKILQHHEIRKASPLFSSAEDKILKSIKAQHLSKSWMLELKNSYSLDIIDREIRRRGLPLVVDLDQMEISALDFTAEQWSLRNLGNPQGVDLDPMLVYRVPGRAGEDIRYVPSPAIGRKIRVAVFDTGMDVEHPDLKDLVVRKASECAALEKYKACLNNKPDDLKPGEKHQDYCDNKWINNPNPEVDQDKNGYPMDCHGWSVTGQAKVGKIMGRPDFADPVGHGTHVTGIIAAARGNGIGIDGVSGNVEILPIQVIADKKPSEPLKPLSVDLDPVEPPGAPGSNPRKTYGLASFVARGVIYAIHSGAHVLNFSMGWPQGQDSEFMRSVIEEAQRRGIIVVAAAGNDSTRALLRPCAYKSVICVGSHGPDGAPSHFSNFGSGVDIFAPGLNMLSTYPMSMRPIRFRADLGYEYFSGTSQATPVISGVVAELLSRGIPSHEIQARLLMGSRPLQAPMNLTVGTSHGGFTPLPADVRAYTKWGAGGLVDMERALKMPAVPVVMPIEKEKIEVPWDRKSAELSFKFSMKNIWREVESSQVFVQAGFPKPHAEAIRPRMISVIPAKQYGAIWKSQEIREYVATFRIEDSADASKSRIPGDMDVLVTTQIGQSKRSDYIPLEVTVAITAETLASDIRAHPISNMPDGDIEFTPIDLYLGTDRTRREYILTRDKSDKPIGQKGDKLIQTIWSLQMKDDKFLAVGGKEITISLETSDKSKLSMSVSSRMDWDFDGDADYVVGYVENTSSKKDAKVSPWTFFIFDSKMQQIESFKVDSTLAQMPVENVYWQRIGNFRRPSWVGYGLNPDKKRGLRDRWENPDDLEDPEIRFFYLDQDKKLKALQKYEEFYIIDILTPNWQQEDQGRLPVLLAKNLGTESKPSYLYEFATAEIIDGKVENFKKIDLFTEGAIYRNMLDTRVSRVISLNPKDEYLRGTFWFGEGRPRQQRLTTLDNQDLSLKDYFVAALRAQFDSALFVKGVFQGKQDQFAFILTNSEIQFHQLNKNRIAQVSLERYSFFGANLVIDSYHPVTVKSSQSDFMLPSLLVPEGIGVNRGVKLLAPVFAYNGDVIELVSPARLRFKTDTDVDRCIPMETPVFEGERGTSLDFYCKKSQSILRAGLVY